MAHKPERQTTADRQARGIRLESQGAIRIPIKGTKQTLKITHNIVAIRLTEKIIKVLKIEQHHGKMAEVNQGKGQQEDSFFFSGGGGLFLAETFSLRVRGLPRIHIFGYASEYSSSITSLGIKG